MRQIEIRPFLKEMDPSSGSKCALRVDDYCKTLSRRSNVETPDVTGALGEEDSVVEGMDLCKKRRRVAASPTVVDDGMTAYERLREENIRRNNEILQSLGIGTVKAELERRGGGNALSCAAPRVKSKIPAKMPLRRSARVRAREQGDATEIGSILENLDGEDGTEEGAKPVAELLTYDESLVVRYTCNWASSMSAEANVLSIQSETDASPGPAADHQDSRCSDVSNQEIIGFQHTGKHFIDSTLTRIYTMDTLFSGEGEAVLLAAAGHQGRISIYGASISSSVGCEPCEGEVAPLLSWKAGAGWISQVQFLSTQNQSGATLLLSSSNDKRVTLWDVNKQHQQLRGTLPRVVAQTTELHSGGIFAMHEYQGQIATSSKDSSVSVAVLADGNFRQVRSISGFYGAVKGVRFRDSNVMASCGMNGVICLLDLRLRGACTKTLGVCHLTSVNVVEWNSWQDNLLLSASNDPELVIYDIRKPSSHLHKLSGHVHPTVTKCKNIYRPAFVHNGRAVATPGERTDNISLYSVVTGNAISRGDVGCNPTMVMSTTRECRGEQLWVACKHISLLVPILK